MCSSDLSVIGVDSVSPHPPHTDSSVDSVPAPTSTLSSPPASHSPSCTLPSVSNDLPTPATTAPTNPIPPAPLLRKSTRLSKAPSYLQDYRCSTVVTN